MKGKKEIVIGTVVTVMVIITLFLYLTGAREIQLNEILLVGITLALTVLAIYIVWDKIKNLQKGLPAKDERIININYKAGYFAFMAAIWSAVLSPMITDFMFGYELKGGDVTAIVVLVSGFVFVISYLYLCRKGS